MSWLELIFGFILGLITSGIIGTIFYLKQKRDSDKALQELKRRNKEIIEASSRSRILAEIHVLASQAQQKYYEWIIPTLYQDEAGDWQEGTEVGRKLMDLKNYYDANKSALTQEQQQSVKKIIDNFHYGYTNYREVAPHGTVDEG